MLWPAEQAGDGHAAIVADLAKSGEAVSATVVTARQTAERVHGVSIPLGAAVPILATLAADDVGRVPASVGAWSLATKLALDLIARERVAPVISVTEAGAEARVSSSRVGMGRPAKSRRHGMAMSRAQRAERFTRALSVAMPVLAYIWR